MILNPLLLAIFVLLPSIAIGQTYWQQQVDHDIQVWLDDESHQLHAFETVTYTNNSPDTLTEIWFHLWPNAYQRGTALDHQMRQDGNLSLYYSKAEDRGFIDSLDFRVEGITVGSSLHSKFSDIILIQLNQLLLPGGKIKISTPFRVDIPTGIFSRLGHLEQAYQITQWYPKPAVYDHKGWHPMPYLGQGEFYSEFGTYDVHITLPKNYVVGATGDLINGDAELDWLLEKAKKTAEIKLFDLKDLQFPKSDKENKTLHFHQENVHDFAWFADKRYHVLKGEVEMPDSKRKVTTWAMFTNNEADLWQNSIEYLNDATMFYSEKVGEYPYNQVTAVDGVLSEGGGMEYPNITIIGESGNAKALEETIMHEVGHNWFYSMLASNERKHPWMDEGMNSFIESRYMQAKYPNLKIRDSYIEGKLLHMAMRLMGVYNLEQRELGRLSYGISARNNTDQPMELPAKDFTSINYGTIVYQKSAAVLSYLQSFLGEAKMDTVMHHYLKQWRFKHPYPEDFRKVVLEVTGDSLCWFFDDLVNTDKTLDYSISNAQIVGGSLKIKVRNVGKVIAPFPIAVMRNDSIQDIYWFPGAEGSFWVVVKCDACDKILIDANNTIPDINMKNNSMQVIGFGKDINPMKAHLAAFIEADDRSHIAFSPILGGNTTDGFMLGMAIYNDILPKNRFSYTIMPMYAFGSKGLTGMADIHYTVFQKEQLPSVKFRIQGQRFMIGQPTNSPYLPGNIIRPEISLLFHPENRRSNIAHDIRLRVNLFIRENSDKVNPVIPQLTYVFNQSFKPHSSRITADLQWFEGHTKLSLEAIYSFAFRRSRGLRARFFIGKIFRESFSSTYNFRMSSHRGYQDYLHEGAFFGRNETSGFAAQQMIEADGGFKTYMNIGASNNWLTALNLSSTLYRKIPLELFLSIGASSNTGSAFPGSETFLVEFGASINIIPNVLAVHFPFLLSGDVKHNVELNTDNYWQRIRFTFNVNEIKPRQRLQAMFN
jgi:hypothetical protein